MLPMMTTKTGLTFFFAEGGGRERREKLSKYYKKKSSMWRGHAAEGTYELHR